MTITWKIAVLGELLYAVIAVVVLVSIAKSVARTHYRNAEALKNIAGWIGYSTFWGMIWTALFSFHGERTGFALMSSVLFMTFAYPVLAYLVYDEAQSGKSGPVDHMREMLNFIGCLLASTILAAGALWAACMNSSLAECAIYVAVAVPCLVVVFLFEVAIVTYSRPIRGWM